MDSLICIHFTLTLLSSSMRRIDDLPQSHVTVRSDDTELTEVVKWQVNISLAALAALPVLPV